MFLRWAYINRNNISLQDIMKTIVQFEIISLKKASFKNLLFCKKIGNTHTQKYFKSGKKVMMLTCFLF